VHVPCCATGWTVNVWFETLTPFGWTSLTQTAVAATVVGTRQALGRATTIGVGPGFPHCSSRPSETFNLAGLAPAVCGVAAAVAPPTGSAAEAEVVSTVNATSVKRRTRTFCNFPNTEGT